MDSAYDLPESFGLRILRVQSRPPLADDAIASINIERLVHDRTPADVERVVRPNLMIIPTPCFDGPASIGHPEKPALTRTRVPQPSVDAFDECILDWFARRAEPPMDPTYIGPPITRFPGLIWTVIEHDLGRNAALTHHPLSHVDAG